MVPELQIRAMTIEDLDSVVAIAATLPDAPQWPREAYATALQASGNPRRITLVAEISGYLAGFAVASLLAPEAELESIAVDRDYQGLGAGLALLRALVQHLHHAGVEDLLLEVRASNRAARRLYARMGFAETGQRRGYYTEPVEDAVLLRLSLQE